MSREPKWSSDEKLLALQLGSRINIYMDGQLDRFAHYIQTDNVKTFSVSPSVAPNYYISIFTPGKFF